MTIPPMTEARFLAIATANAHRPDDDPARPDIDELLTEVHRVAGDLAAAWVLLDDVARSRCPMQARGIPRADCPRLPKRAADLLRAQNCPGWVSPATAEGGAV